MIPPAAFTRRLSHIQLIRGIFTNAVNHVRFFFLYRKVHKFISNLSTVNSVQMIQDCLKVSLLFARSIGWRLCDMQDTCCEDESSGRDQQDDCRI